MGSKSDVRGGQNLSLNRPIQRFEFTALMLKWVEVPSCLNQNYSKKRVSMYLHLSRWQILCGLQQLQFTHSEKTVFDDEFRVNHVLLSIR